MIYTDRILVMDYRHLCTKHFVKSCQLPDNGYCSILASLTKPVSCLWISLCLSWSVTCAVQKLRWLHRCPQQRWDSKDSRCHPCALRPLNHRPQAFVTAGISLMPGAVETQSLRIGEVAVNFPVGMNPQGTSLLQEQPTLPFALTAGQCRKPGMGEDTECHLYLNPSREGMGAECNVLVALQFLLGLLGSGHCRALGKKQMSTSGVSPPSPTFAFLISLLQLLPASLSCLIGVINEGVSHPLTRQAYILGLMTLILLMLSLSPFNCFISGVTAGSHLTSDKSQAPAD